MNTFDIMTKQKAEEYAAGPKMRLNDGVRRGEERAFAAGRESVKASLEIAIGFMKKSREFVDDRCLLDFDREVDAVLNAIRERGDLP